MPYRTDPCVLALAAHGFIEPVGRRASYTASRLAILSDRTTKPVLLILAEAKFTSWEAERFPFWIDGDQTNETLSNVGLATKSPGISATRRRRSKTVGSGTREYMKRWRTSHPELVRAAQLRYNAKRAAAIRAASPIDESSSSESGEAAAAALPPALQRLQDLLNDV